MGVFALDVATLAMLDTRALLHRLVYDVCVKQGMPSLSVQVPEKMLSLLLFTATKIQILTRTLVQLLTTLPALIHAPSHTHPPRPRPGRVLSKGEGGGGCHALAGGGGGSRQWTVLEETLFRVLTNMERQVF